MIQESTLDAELRAFAASFAWLSLLIAGVNGAIIYLALRQLLVLPMRRLTRSIVAFRSDPERAAPLDPQQITVLPDDEMAVAGRELASMQRALRVALGRNARLAAVGTAVAKVAHDLRNVLAPALLSAESLEGAFRRFRPSLRRRHAANAGSCGRTRRADAGLRPGGTRSKLRGGFLSRPSGGRGCAGDPGPQLVPGAKHG